MQKNRFGYIFLCILMASAVCYFGWEPYFNYYEDAGIKIIHDVCNGSLAMKKAPELKCYTRRSQDPYEIFDKPTKIEVLSWQPFMTIYHDVFTTEEILKQKREISRMRFNRAMAFGKYGFMYHSHSRAGLDTWVDGGSDDIAEMWFKINRATGLQVDPYSTGFKILMYKKGDFYRLHHDGHAFERLRHRPFSSFIESLLHPFMEVYNACGFGRIPRPPWSHIYQCSKNYLYKYFKYGEPLPNRLGTVILPVTQWKSGGETIFPELGWKVKLPARSFLFFITLFPDSTLDERHLHGACPLLSDDTKVLMQGRVLLDGHVINGANYVFGHGSRHRM